VLPSVTVNTVVPDAAAEVVVAAIVVAEVWDDVVVDVLQDASSIAATNNKLKPNQVTFLFIFPPFLIYIL
jgi:hypothetical protein